MPKNYGPRIGEFAGPLGWEQTDIVDRASYRWRLLMRGEKTRHLYIIIRNCTRDELHTGGVIFQKRSYMWEHLPLPKVIKPRTTTVCLANGDEGDTVQGSLWYKIGTQNDDQINIDFSNYNWQKTNDYKAKTNNENWYSVGWEGSHEADSVLDVRLGYNFHDKQVFGTSLLNSPSGLIWRPTNTLYCLYRGFRNDGPLYYKSFDGQHWTSDTEAKINGEGISMADSPAGVEFKGKMFCLYQGPHNGELWNATFDGNSWVGKWQMSPSRLTCSPCGVVYRDRLYCIFQSADRGGALWFRTHDGSNWSDEKKITADNVMCESPSAVVWEDKLYCFFQGREWNAALCYIIFDGNAWTSPVQVDAVGMSGSPAPIVVNNHIRIYHQSMRDSGYLYAIDFEGEEGDIPVPCVGMSCSPSVVMSPSDGKIICLRQGHGQKGTLYSVWLPPDH